MCTSACDLEVQRELWFDRKQIDDLLMVRVGLYTILTLIRMVGVL
jgi:hypothetical protein